MKRYLLLIICAATFGFAPLQARQNILKVYGNAGSRDVTIDFHAPQRGILTKLLIEIPGNVEADYDSTTVDVIGRGDVLLSDLAHQYMGRYGSAYSRSHVGNALYILAEGNRKIHLLTFSDIDLRPDNGIDLRIVLHNVSMKNPKKLHVKASWKMQTPELPAELQGASYVVHDPQKVNSVTASYQQLLAVSRKTYNAKALGLRGDGKADDTSALNRAIQRLNVKGGGIIHFPAGTYCLRSVRLLSHVWLHLDAEATLKAISGMNDPETSWFVDNNINGTRGTLDTTPYDTYDNFTTKQDFGHSFFENTMFLAVRAEDIRIYGQGRITGNGILETLNTVMDNPSGMRADKMMTFKLCRNIEIGGEDCPADMWYDEQQDVPAYLMADGSLDASMNKRMLHLDQGGHFIVLATGTDSLRIHDIYCGEATTDAARDIFDFMSCNEVSVRNVYNRATGDDIVKLGSDCSLGFTRKSRNTFVRNIVGDTHCNLFQIGSETADDITDVYVDNIYVLAADKAGFSISVNDGGTVSRVYLNSGETGPLHHRSQMRHTRTPLFLSLSNRARVIGAQVGEYYFREGDEMRHELLAKNVNIGHISDVRIAHVDCRDVYAASSCYREQRWEKYDGTQGEATPIVAGFKIPDTQLVEGGLDFTLPDGRTTGYVERVTVDDVSIRVLGGHPESDAQLVCPEIGIGKFNVVDLKTQPAYGFWARHARGLTLKDVRISCEREDGRPIVVLDDVLDADVSGVRLESTE